MARRAGEINKQRQNAEHVLLLDSGDALNGEEGLGLLTKGEVQVKAMNLMGYDAMTLGSGDFVIGMDLLRQRMQAARFPMLSANVILSDTGQLVGQPYVIKELTPENKVAIIGLTDPYVVDLVRAVRGPAVRVEDAVATVRRYVAEVSGQANIIIVLSHMGFDADQQLARQVSEIDVIVGGKSGHLLDPPVRPDPEGAVFVQAGSLGQRLGLVWLDFDEQGNIIQVYGHPIVLGPEASIDSEMIELLRSYEHLLPPTPHVAPPVIN